MQAENRVPIFRKDYKMFDFIVQYLELKFELHEEMTMVTATAEYKRNPLTDTANPSLILYGEQLELIELKINNEILETGRYRNDGKTLQIDNVPENFVFSAVTRIYPDKNKALEGLYKSAGNYCTQCEAEGFRRITFFPDRPDVLTRFTTRIEADKLLYPFLLSNGNLIETGELPNQRHYAVWHDPFPKPCYLFALVAGKFVPLEDRFVTRAGKAVSLKIFVEEQNAGKCGHAMTSLKKAMQWDEEVFGLEYDLDTFMIVAVDDFNMGAMENKGLNIFNAKYILSTPETATDNDYLGIEGVVAHEYFHNWTGNRVTCRDWFQLSLKEGLTVFRDQEFSSDMNSPAVQRIDDVRQLKNFQFKEDAGPMAHPVRPDSFMEINNFYTATVYNKGAEVIRMMQTLLGRENFRKGMDLYFSRHDGQAVTCDDFVTAMSDASGIDLTQFRLWYSQIGTPELEVIGNWDKKAAKYTINVSQKPAQVKGNETYLPYHMPLAVGLLNREGEDLLTDKPEGTTILQLRQQEQSFEFMGIEEEPVISFLRDFSAPVKVAKFQTRKELAFLMRFDSNLYNRWDASARLAGEIILEIADQLQRDVTPVLDRDFAEAFTDNLTRPINDPALLALAMSLPPETTLAQDMSEIDPDALHEARKFVKKELACNNQEVLENLYRKNGGDAEYSLTPLAMGQRSLRNAALSYLLATNPLSEEHLNLCLNHYYMATNMTDRLAAMTCISHLENESKEQLLGDFYQKWHADPQVIDKWFSVQAMSSCSNTLERVKRLLGNPAFSIENPNRVRALIGAFCSGNHVRFHAIDGAGYKFLAEQIEKLNNFNPMIAARMITPLISWRRYDPARQDLMRTQLQRIAELKELSRDVYEIVTKCLG